MPRFQAEDTMVGVQQPDLDLNRPRTNLIKPIATAMEGVAGLLKPKGSDPLSVVNGVAESYNKSIESARANNTLNNESIVSLNRDARLALQKEAIKNGLSIEDYNKMQTALSSVFDSESAYTVTNIGTLSIQQNRNGEQKVLVNNVDAYKEKSKMDAIIEMTTPYERAAAVSGNLNDTLKIGFLQNRFLLQSDKKTLEIQSAKAAAEQGIWEWGEKQQEDIKAYMSMQTEAVYQREFFQAVNSIYASNSTGETNYTYEEILPELKRLASLSGMVDSYPDGSAMASRYGMNLNEVSSRLNALIPTKEEFIARTTTLDNMDLETMAINSRLNNEEAKVRLNIPASVRNKNTIYKTIKDAALSYELATTFLGRDNPDVTVIDMVGSSDTLLRDTIAPNMSGFSDLNDPKYTEKQGIVVDMVKLSMMSLAKGDLENTPLSFEALSMVVDTIKKTEGYSRWSEEEKNGFNSKYNEYLNALKAVHPAAMKAWEKEKEKYDNIYREKYGFMYRTFHSNPSDLPTDLGKE